MATRHVSTPTLFITSGCWSHPLTGFRERELLPNCGQPEKQRRYIFSTLSKRKFELENLKLAKGLLLPFFHTLQQGENSFFSFKQEMQSTSHAQYGVHLLLPTRIMVGTKT